MTQMLVDERSFRPWRDSSRVLNREILKHLCLSAGETTCNDASPDAYLDAFAPEYHRR
jgi:hypothetical protein